MDEMYDDADEVGQYSDESREALRRQTETLIAGLRGHTEALLDLLGGSAEPAGLFERHEAVETLIRTWNDAVFDHTGTFALPLDEPDEDGLGEDDDAVLETDVISIITRVDLTLEDPAVLLTAGRAAYQRLWSEEPEESGGTEADVEASVPDAVQALYALGQEAGEPWLELPGTAIASAVRAYVVPEPPYQPPQGDLDEPDDPDTLLDQVAVPRGTLIFSESWD